MVAVLRSLLGSIHVEPVMLNRGSSIGGFWQIVMGGSTC